MNILVISDTHLSNKFEERKFGFLKKIISNADKVIINGDFWEGHLISFSEFINSPWRELFPLLKEKKAVYIYGNHDKESYCDERVKLFSDVAVNEYSMVIDNKKLVFKHGHQFFSSKEDNMPRFMTKFFLNLLAFGVKITKSRVTRLFRVFNFHIKNKIKKMKNKSTLFFFGHTHSACIDRDFGFINTGFIGQGFATYVIIKNPKLRIKLVEERY